jgi:hypothetical protein
MTEHSSSADATNSGICSGVRNFYEGYENFYGTSGILAEKPGDIIEISIRTDE